MIKIYRILRRTRSIRTVYSLRIVINKTTAKVINSPTSYAICPSVKSNIKTNVGNNISIPLRNYFPICKTVVRAR